MSLCKCINSSNHDLPTMYEHLTINGMLPDYRIWDFHGEKSMGQSRNNMSSGLQASSKPVSEKTNNGHVVQEMLREAFGMHEEPFMNNENCFGTSTSHTTKESNVENFYRLVDVGKQPLYTGCTEFSKLTFLVELFQLKVSGKWSDKSFTALLDFLRRVLPSGYDVLSMTQYNNVVYGKSNASAARVKTGSMEQMWRKEHEPFILASQAQMVYYVHDPKEEDWFRAIRHTPKDTYNMGDEEDIDTMHFVDNNFSSIQSLLSDINEEDVELTRYVEGSIVDGMSVVGNETDDENFN